MGEGLTRAAFGSGEVIAFGKRVFIFIAARIFVREILTDGFLRLLGRYVLIRSPHFTPLACWTTSPPGWTRPR